MESPEITGFYVLYQMVNPSAPRTTELYPLGYGLSNLIPNGRVLEEQPFAFLRKAEIAPAIIRSLTRFIHPNKEYAPRRTFYLWTLDDSLGHSLSFTVPISSINSEFLFEVPVDFRDYAFTHVAPIDKYSNFDIYWKDVSMFSLYFPIIDGRTYPTRFGIVYKDK